jgi:hypothetical protein
MMEKLNLLELFYILYCFPDYRCLVLFEAKIE